MAQFHGSLCRFRKELEVVRYLLSIIWCIDFATDVEFVEWHKSFKSLKIDFCNNIMIFHQTKWTIQVMQGCTVFANPRSVVGQFSFDGEGNVGAMP